MFSRPPRRGDNANANSPQVSPSYINEWLTAASTNGFSASDDDKPLQAPPSRPRRNTKFEKMDPSSSHDNREEPPPPPSRPKRNTMKFAPPSSNRRLSTQGKSILKQGIDDEYTKVRLSLPDHLVDRTQRTDVEQLLTDVTAAKKQLDAAVLSYSQLCQSASLFVSRVQDDGASTVFDEQRAEVVSLYRSEGMLELAQCLTHPEDLTPETAQRK